MVWVNGSQNLGLVNFRRPGIAFTIVQISSSKNGREGLKLVTKIALMKWNTDFRLEHLVQFLQKINCYLLTGGMKE